VIDNPEEPEGAVLDIDNPCYGEDFGKITIDNVLGGIAPFQFSIDSGGYGGTNEFRNLAPDFYKMGIKDVTGCEWDTIIQLQAQPEISVDLGEDELIQLGCPIEVAAFISFPAEQLDTLIWQSTASCPGCFSQTDTLVEATKYSVTAIDQNGCETSDEKTVLVEKERLIFIPNAFSPNDDGINDIFMIYGGKGVQQVKSLRVFDRWGATLLEKNDFQPEETAFGWDGRLKGKALDNGMYIYVAEVEFIDGWVELYKGSVALIR